MIRRFSRKLLDITGLYPRFRYSGSYDWYARFLRTAYAAALNADRQFYHSLFKKYGVRTVFDVGANVGDKCRVFREAADSVVCVEADPATAAILRYRFRS